MNSGTESSSEKSSSAESAGPSSPKKKKNAGKRARKTLAKKAAKKGVNKSERSILKQQQEAKKIESEMVPQMEAELVKIENHLKIWKEKKVEDHALQRFVARILAKVKDLNIIGMVDHAIFKQEMGSIHLLEMELVDTTNNDTINSEREHGRVKANELLSKIVDISAMSRLNQTKAGTAWLVDPDSASTGKLL